MEHVQILQLQRPIDAGEDFSQDANIDRWQTYTMTK